MGMMSGLWSSLCLCVFYAGLVQCVFPVMMYDVRMSCRCGRINLVSADCILFSSVFTAVYNKLCGVNILLRDLLIVSFSVVIWVPLCVHWQYAWYHVHTSSWHYAFPYIFQISFSKFLPIPSVLRLSSGLFEIFKLQAPFRPIVTWSTRVIRMISQCIYIYIITYILLPGIMPSNKFSRFLFPISFQFHLYSGSLPAFSRFSSYRLPSGLL